MEKQRRVKTIQNSRRSCAISACVKGILLFFILTVICPVRPAYANAVPEDPVFVVGNKKLADQDAFVFVVLGDGFTAEDRALFYEKAKETAAYILDVSPYREHAELFKFYALFQASEEQGARGDAAKSESEAQSDERETVYHSSYWTDGEQRLLALPEKEEKKACLIAKQYVPDMDVPVLLVNDTVYGGSGGTFCVASLHEDSPEIILHELGHTIAGLGDEYWPGADKIEEAPNVSFQQEKENVPWADLVGTDGIGIYAFEEGSPGWYKPSDSCKMQYLGSGHEFCAVCKQALVNSFYQKSHPEALEKLQMWDRVKQILVWCAPVAVGICVIYGIYHRKKRAKSMDET